MRWNRSPASSSSESWRVETFGKRRSRESQLLGRGKRAVRGHDFGDLALKFTLLRLQIVADRFGLLGGDSGLFCGGRGGLLCCGCIRAGLLELSYLTGCLGGDDIEGRHLVEQLLRESLTMTANNRLVRAPW